MELKINVLSRFLNKSGQTTDSSEYTTLAGRPVKIPKLTPAKYKALLERVEALPAIIAAIATNWNVDNAIATLLAGVERGLDEAVAIVAVLADMDAEAVEAEADLNEITDFIRLTIEKNDIQRALKNFRAVLGHFRAGTTNPMGDDGN